MKILPLKNDDLGAISAPTGRGTHRVHEQHPPQRPADISAAPWSDPVAWWIFDAAYSEGFEIHRVQPGASKLG